MIKKYLGNIILCILLVFLFTACSAGGEKEISSSDEQEIIDEMNLLVDTFDENDPQKIYDLCSEEVQNEDDIDKIQKFCENYSGSIKAYVDTKSYIGNEDPEKMIEDVEGIIVSQDNIYVLHFNFMPQTDSITKLWIVSGETESMENLDWANKYSFDNSDSFEYADYYDTGLGDYRLIWSKVLKWDDSANVVDQDDLKSKMTEQWTIEDVVNQYGVYAAEYNGAYHFYCYPSTSENEYLQIFMNEDGTIDEVSLTDEIDYGIMGMLQVK